MNEIKENIEEQGNNVLFKKKVTDAYVELFTIKLFGATASQHLVGMQDWLYRNIKIILHFQIH